MHSAVQSAVCNKVGQTSSKGECAHLQVFSDARRSDPGKLAASCTSTSIKTIVTLKSHEKEGARSEPIKQTQTSARRMHSFYTIPMGCGYLPGGCERDSRPQEAALMELTASLCTLRLMITPILILLIKLTSPYVKEPNIHADSLKQDVVEEETTACSIMMIKAEDEHSIRLPIRDPSFGFLLLG